MHGRCLKQLIVFQFTPLREGRPHANRYFVGKVLFQFTPLREGRPKSRRA